MEIEKIVKSISKLIKFCTDGSFHHHYVDIEKDLKPYLEFVSGICGERIEKLDSSDIKIVYKSDEAYVSFRPKTNTGIKIGEVRFGFSGWQINSRDFRPSMKIIAYCGDAVIKIEGYDKFAIIIDNPNNPDRGIYYIDNSKGSVMECNDTGTNKMNDFNLWIQYVDGEHLDKIMEKCVTREEMIEKIPANHSNTGYTSTPYMYFENGLSNETIFRTFTEGNPEKLESWISSLFRKAKMAYNNEKIIKELDEKYNGVSFDSIQSNNYFEYLEFIADTCELRIRKVMNHALSGGELSDEDREVIDNYVLFSDPILFAGQADGPSSYEQMMKRTFGSGKFSEEEIAYIKEINTNERAKTNIKK